MTLDLTGFCWELLLRRDGRVRFVLYCAPGKAAELRKRLEDMMGIRLRRYSRSSLRTDNPAEVLAVVAQLEVPGGVVDELTKYVDFWRQKRCEQVDVGRRKHARRAVVLAGGRLG